MSGETDLGDAITRAARRQRCRFWLRELWRRLRGRRHPFSCGTQYGDWRDRNCDRCSKGQSYDAETDSWGPWRCPLERALSEAALGDGTVSRSVARRIGLPWHDGDYSWDCHAREIR